MKKRSFFDICTFVTKLIFGCLLAFAIFLLIVYAIHDKGGGIPIDEITYLEHWTVTDGDGRSFETGRSYFAEKEYDKDFTITSALPSRVEENTFLCFPTGKNLSVYIGDELRYTYDEIKDVKLPGGAVKRFFLLVPLSPEDSGKELRIERASTSRNGQIVPVSFVGSQGAIYAHMMKEYGLTFMLAEVIQIFAAIVVLVGIALSILYRRKIYMLYGALGIFVVASWVVVDSFLFPFIFGHYHVDGIVSYLLSLMIPFGPAIYLNAIQHGRHQKTMTVVFVLASANAILWPILHFTGIFPFYDALSYINIFQAIEAGLGFFVLIVDVVRGKAKEYIFTAIGFFGFILCGFYEVFSFLFLSPQKEELPMVIGLAVFLMFVVIQQVEDLRKTFAEKQHAVDLSQAKSRFLASMSHEIRTPINSILGMNEMILRENKDKVIEEYAQNIKSSGNMLLMLVNDVLDFSRIEAGKLEINETKFQLSDVLHDVISLCRERAQEKSLEFKIELEDGIPNGLISDEFRIRQILVNLLSNAVKYTDKGHVLLKVEAHVHSGGDGAVYFTVSDTGRGIRKEDQDTLFDAFTRADLAKNSNIEGTGLGLAIVNSIVSSMNGIIMVYSEYGVGSSFTVQLPVKIVNMTPLTMEALNQRSQDHSHEAKCDYVAPSASVLAVDDNQSNLTIARLFLKRTRVQTDFCDSGEKAIQKCKEKKYDVILLDHMMPHP
ncbi:MAG: response regulator, partial [Lachnospiraceae bacterium]|nr:response regulator [Lachnospiraceae bacterium]